MIREERGFTFVEMLFVLLIAGMAASLPLFYLLPWHESRKLEQFVEQFREDTMFMQQAAISNNGSYQLRMFPKEHLYTIAKAGTLQTVLVREYHGSLQIDQSTLQQPVTYGADGNVNRGGTMYVSYGKKKYRIVFYLGQGRFACLLQ
ncbi:competence type IV pilus minor pilin ComGD [Ectobacillus ponti]|uniref:Type II secretion system GspH family protein n=1 Tax=Ectobacillus ponti TaxID=2961894 RepID=A0AA41X5N3_9BACI|nr:competence type IV pilus minor pilin ComGD [Ectobacillus ponti]MCP8967099.1 type II secretion system GspH family protein [Ectobacillus ponti]